MRQTRQRAAVLKALHECHEHPTAEWVHARVAEEIPSVSLATVYRLLNQLTSEGLIASVPVSEGPGRYDGNPGTHQHVICSSCGKVADVPELLAPEARRVIERWTGYAVSDVRMHWVGLCPACRAASRPSEPSPTSD